ncbi:hypothetical protein [Flagellimonas sp.]|uniref:hypothetical protein n=1 Tax=Flagellimonas sp. TaxID=2058762 RepID=UPI003B50378D
MKVDFDNYSATAYTFYPKNISPIQDLDKYLDSTEYKKLLSFLSQDKDIYGTDDLSSIMDEIGLEFDSVVEDVTVPSWHDRCINLQFLLNSRENESKKNVACINLSKLDRVYLVYILEVEYDEKLNRLKYLPRRNKLLESTEFNSHITTIKWILENRLENMREFPDDLIDRILPDIGFQDIDLGRFTMFNCFFLNNFTTRFA